MASKRRRLRGKTPDALEADIFPAGCTADALRAQDLQLERELTEATEEVYDFAASCSGGEVCIDLEAGLELGATDDDDNEKSGIELGAELSDGDEVETPVQGARGWRPGYDVGEWVGRNVQLEPQAQVLALNVVLALRRLPSHVLQLLCCRRRKKSGYISAAASLLCVASARLERLLAGVAARQWHPVGYVESVAEPPCGETNRKDAVAEEKTLTTLVRAALVEAVSSASGRGYPKHIARLHLCGVAVGDRFHTKAFAYECWHLASKAMQSQDRLDLDRRLGGLGIPSDFAVLADGVPVGGVNLYNRHGSVIVICTISVAASTGLMHPRFVAWSVGARGHKGPDVAKTLLETLAEPPLALTTQTLSKRLSCVGGDGAYVRGGPARTSKSSQVLDLLWFLVHPHELPPLTDDDNLIALVREAPVDGRPRGGARRATERDAWVNEACVLHTVAEWDKFHRQDLAMTRAIVKCHLANEMYELCALMDHMFGLGDGRQLIKTAAAAATVQLRSGRLPGMTRKAVQLCGEPGHLLHNFKAYAAGIHLKEQWRKDGHSDSAAKLVAAGQRLTDLSTVSFTLLFRDILSGVVAPWALAVQDSSMEPWLVQKRRRQHDAAMAVQWEVLQYLRGVLRILVLLRQWVPLDDMAHFIRALVHARASNFYFRQQGDAVAVAFGKCFPSWLYALGGLLLGNVPTFQGVELQCPAESWQIGMRVLGPHCQCRFLRPRTSRNSKLVLVRPRRGRCPTRRWRVPLWVSEADPPPRREAGGADALEAGGDAREAHGDAFEAGEGTHTVASQPWLFPSPPPIRFHWCNPASLAVPAGVRPEGRFRARIAIGHPPGEGGPCYTSACHLSVCLPQIFMELDRTLAAAARFINTLSAQEELVFGREGQSAGMSAAHEAMCKCFDWDRHVHTAPTADDVTAVMKLNQLLRPYLRLTEYPSQHEFPGVVHGWPDDGTLATQYVVLMRRVRLAKTQCRAATRGWWHLTGYTVSPIVCSAILRRLVEGVLRQAETAPREARELRCISSRVASILQRFLVVPNTLAVEGMPGHFVVSPTVVARIGVPWSSRTKGLVRRSATAQWGIRNAEPGGLATLLLSGVLGKLVYIEQRRRELDWSAVSGSIDVNPYFSRDGPKGSSAPRSAWHAARLHHRCRSMGAPEACCERVGSMMKSTWTKNNNLPVSSLMDIVGLNFANVACTGAVRDERLCSVVAGIMLDLGRRSHTYGGRHIRRRAAAGVDVSWTVQNMQDDHTQALRAAGRSDGFDPDAASTDDEGFDLEVARPLSSARPAAAVAALHAVGSAGIQHSIRGARNKGNPAMLVSDRAQKALMEAAKSGVKALPLWHSRSSSTKPAASVMKERLKSWLESDSGRAWQTLRNQRIAESVA